MKATARNLLLPCAVMAGLALMSTGRLRAQNYADWPVTGISAGYFHSLFTRSDGTVFVMGANYYGQLGLGPTVTNVTIPTALTNGVGAISAGGYHSLMVRGNKLLAMGANWDGQLGDGTTNNQSYPEVIVTLTATLTVSFSFTSLAAGYEHSLLGFANNRSPGGGFEVMGDNSEGQLGDGTYNNHLTPEQIVSWSGSQPAVTACAAGFDHSLFVKSDGSLWGMGDSASGELGDNAPGTANNFQIQIASDVSPETADVTAVDAGQYDSFFILTGGPLWAMGANSSGELGLGEYAGVGYNTVTSPLQVSILKNPSSVKAVSCGYASTLILLSDNTLWAAGDNFYGELGLGASLTVTNIPQFVTSNVVAVSSSYQHSLFIKSDGSLWGMGYNGDGELGTGDYNSRYTPVEIVGAPPPPPQLSLLSYGADAILAWPTNSAGFILESTPSLSPPAWTAVSPGPIIVGNQYFAVFNTASAPQTFYRLVWNP